MQVSTIEPAGADSSAPSPFAGAGVMRTQCRAELLSDGAQIQRVMAELHGMQRHRLGWGEVDLERERPIMLAEIERVLRGGGDAERGGAAVRFAMDVAHHVLEQATRTAIRAHRFAKAAGTH